MKVTTTLILLCLGLLGLGLHARADAFLFSNGVYTTISAPGAARCAHKRTHGRGALSPREGSSQLWHDSLHKRASMEPRSIDRGNLAMEINVPTFFIVSMGPRSVDRGNESADCGTQDDGKASMGPRSVDRGDRLLNQPYSRTCTSFNGAAIS
jgi:hypothetical protein